MGGEADIVDCPTGEARGGVFGGWLRKGGGGGGEGGVELAARLDETGEEFDKNPVSGCENGRDFEVRREFKLLFISSAASRETISERYFRGLSNCCGCCKFL